MSKLAELQKKYSTDISSIIFQSFVAADKTETKKYLEFMCKLWVDRQKNKITRSAKVIELVNNFDSCINYLSNKDIYSPEYTNLTIFQARIDDAMSRKSEKEFDSKKHGTKIYETDDFLIIRPLTQEGSDKWGANTKWCTTGRNSRFKEYFRRGVLIYLISKKNSRISNYNKIAFYTNWDNHTIYTNNIEVYNQTDGRIYDRQFISNGWSREEIITIFNVVRTYMFNLEFTFKAKENVSDTIRLLNSIDISKLIDSTNVVKESNIEDRDYILEIKNNIDFITNKLKQII
jgi:hypothetical protein